MCNPCCVFIQIKCLGSFGQRGKGEEVFIYSYYHYDWSVGEARHDKILVDREKACNSQFRRYFMFLIYSREQNDETMNATGEDKL